MSFFIAISILVLVVFMVVAMVMAEWGNKDPGDWLAMIWKRKKNLEPDLNAAASDQPGLNTQEKKVVSRSAKPAGKTKTKTGKSLSAKASGKKTAARKPAAAKRKPQ